MITWVILNEAEAFLVALPKIKHATKSLKNKTIHSNHDGLQMFYNKKVPKGIYIYI